MSIILFSCHFIRSRLVRYGDVFRTHILGKAIVVSTDPDVSKVILQNHGNAFMPCYPKSITELLGKSSILQINGALHKRLHTLIGVFLKSAQLKDRITRDIERIVVLTLSSWMGKTRQLYVQDETKKVCRFVAFCVYLYLESDELKFETETFSPNNLADYI